MKEITEQWLQQVRADYRRDAKAQLLTGAAAKTDLGALSYRPMEGAKLKGAFSIDIKTRGITAQQQSGRCWLFAALNILREKVAEKCNLDEFELSQNYLSFYDKLEKANNFLESVIARADAPVKGQEMQYILNGMSDGGYWCEAVDLVEKYGVVPKQVNPESYQSEHTLHILTVLRLLLRKDAAELRELVKAGKDPYPRKKEMLAEVYKAECIAFGQPVESFDFAYKDKDNKFHVEKNLTPQKFYKDFIGVDLKEYVPVINEPTPDRKLGVPVTFHGNENMVGKDMLALNLPQEDLEKLCIAQLKGGDPIWFACDAGAHGSRKEGVWDPAAVQMEKLLGDIDLTLEKGKRLWYGLSSANHAMLLTGVNLTDDGTPDRWKIENSWGKDVGDAGYFVCSEAYFKEYVYEAVILKKYFTPELLDLLKQEPISIHPWDEDV